MTALTLATRGPDDTAAIGATLGQLVAAGDVLLLRGNLGAGKTRLTQGLARGLGIAQDVTSPTFILVNEYRSGRLPLYHIDLYRIAGDVEADALGLDEYFFGEGVTVVEWPDRAPGALPDEYLAIELVPVAGDEQARHVTVTAAGARATDLLQALREAVARG